MKTLNKKYFLHIIKSACFAVAFMAMATWQLKAQFSQFGNTTGFYPYGIAIDASSNVYTVNQNDGTVTKITAAGITTIRWATVGLLPYFIIVDPSGNVYTTNAGSNTVSKINSSGTVTSFNVGNSPYALAFDGLGNIYVTNNQSTSISKISSTGVVTKAFVTVGAGSIGIATDANNNVYVGTLNKNIMKIDPNGTSTTFIASLPSNPWGLYRDPSSGNMFVTYEDGNGIYDYISEYGPTGSFIKIIQLAQFAYCPQIIGDGKGNLFAAETGTNQVAKINIATGVVTQYTSSPSFYGPEGVALDAFGYLYVANGSNNFVSKSNIALPIALINFTATAANCTANLAWATAVESNSSFYIVEASTDGINFTQLAKVSSQNSATGANYIYVATLGNSSNTYFRLKAVDNDGQFTYSATVMVKGMGNCETGITVKVFPNPTSNIVSLQNTTTGDMITLYDMNGKKMMGTIATGTNQSINIGRYAKGNYLLQIINADGSISNIKVVKQ